MTKYIIKKMKNTILPKNAKIRDFKVSKSILLHLEKMQ